MCDDWFKRSGVKPGPTCLANCASLMTGMATFNCPTDCPRLCKETATTQFLFQLTDLYPSLTASERALASKDPSKALKAYQLSAKAESQCHKLYNTSELNDESDACRHFVWAGLLQNEFGREFAERVLYAHEQEPSQPEEQKAMDLANNQRGVSVAESLIKSKHYSEDALMGAFKEQLKSGRIIVLKKRPTEGVGQ